MKKLTLVLILFVLSGSVYAEKRDAIDFRLATIEKVISGNSIIDSVNISNSLNLLGLNVTSYSDSLLKISWTYNPTNLNFAVENISSESFKIMWDEMSYIDVNNNGHRIFHKGIKINEREKEQAPTVVMRKTSLVDVIIPTDYVTYSDYFNRWLFYFLNSTKNSITDKEIKVLMSLSIKEEIIEYIFTFKLRDLNKKIKAGMNSDGSWSYL